MIHIINSLGMGGAENFLKDVVRPTDTVVTLLKRRCELQVNCSVVALDFLKSPFATISTLRKLVSGRTESSEPVVAWLYLSMLTTLFLAGSSVSICWTVRTSNLGLKSRVHSWLMVYLLGVMSWVVPSSVIYCSKQAMRWHQKKAFWKHGRVVLNGVRPGLKDQRGSYADAPQRELLQIGVIARFDDQKGQRWLLENLASSTVLNEEACYISFFGRGVCTLGSIYNRFGNTQFHETRDSYAVLPKLDVLLMPSLYGEGYPNIVAESLAAGVYVIAADTGSVDEFGLDCKQLFTPGDFAGLERCFDNFLAMSGEEIDKKVQSQKRLVSTQHVRSRQADIFRSYAYSS